MKAVTQTLISTKGRREGRKFLAPASRRGKSMFAIGFVTSSVWLMTQANAVELSSAAQDPFTAASTAIGKNLVRDRGFQNIDVDRHRLIPSGKVNMSLAKCGEGGDMVVVSNELYCCYRITFDGDDRMILTLVASSKGMCRPILTFPPMSQGRTGN